MLFTFVPTFRHFSKPLCPHAPVKYGLSLTVYRCSAPAVMRQGKRSDKYRAVFECRVVKLICNIDQDVEGDIGFQGSSTL